MSVNQRQPQQATFSAATEDSAVIGPVDCLGLTFASDDERRAYFTERLREKLADPAFRSIEGFPIGSDEDILALSDPPYYTACPNPFLEDFVRYNGQPYDPSEPYHKEPFAADVSEGRTDDIYTAHSYHTKVPPRAIAQYILHYTKPGDVVLDAFSGTGMTGVATMLCADHAFTRDYDAEPGARYAILCDLSPAATFVSSVYLCPPDPTAFAEHSACLLETVDEQIGHVWSTKIGDQHGAIEFQVWTETFTCPSCQNPVVSERVVDATEDIGTAKEFACPNCGALVSKAPTRGSNAAKLERRLLTRYDADLQMPVPYLPRTPLFAQAKVGGTRIRVETPDSEKRRLSELALASPHWYPIDKVVDGERFRVKDCCHAYGITHIHHFYLPRQLLTYSALWNEAISEQDYSLRSGLMYFIQSNALGMTVMNRYGPTHFSQVSRYFSGTLYIPSVVAESSYRYTYENKRKRLIKAFSKLATLRTSGRGITTQSSTDLAQIPDKSVDYVFIDPPFGRNLQYSELNQIWEAWLRVRTNREPEAVMDATRHRENREYTSLMRAAFAEMHRVLKPGRWMTVEFHNSSNSVWRAIQEAILSAGFVVADVRTLSKESETYKQSRQGLVKQDLVISAYKPNSGLEQRFQLEAGSEEGVWDFIRTHLRQLPVFVSSKDGRGEVIAERLDYLLFDRMVAFHVQRGVAVPLSAPELYAGLRRHFPQRDGMFFLEDQVAEYERKRLSVREIQQLAIFVTNESSAIQWLRQQLTNKPQTQADLTPQFMRELAGWEKHEKLPEMLELLEQNFLRYDGAGPIPAQIVAWMKKSAELRELVKRESDTGGQREDGGLETNSPTLHAQARDRWYVPDPNKAIDLEKLRTKALLREFAGYVEGRGKLKQFRTEAVKAGFKQAWADRDYQTIVRVSERLPESVLQEDPDLLMYYDNASLRVSP